MNFRFSSGGFGFVLLIVWGMNWNPVFAGECRCTSVSQVLVSCEASLITCRSRCQKAMGNTEKPLLSFQYLDRPCSIEGVQAFQNLIQFRNAQWGMPSKAVQQQETSQWAGVTDVLRFRGKGFGQPSEILYHFLDDRLYAGSYRFEKLTSETLQSIVHQLIRLYGSPLKGDGTPIIWHQVAVQGQVWVYFDTEASMLNYRFYPASS